MNLQDYFNTDTGFGVLATASAQGTVNAAVYSRPHIIDDETVAFIMAGSRSFSNVSENPSALYLFHGVSDDQHRYDGIRLALEMIRVNDDPVTIAALRRRQPSGDTTNRHLVYFKVVEIRPLVGDALS